MKSQIFEVSLKGNHSLEIPEEHALPFLVKGHKRVMAIAEFEGKKLRFHAALQKYKGRYVITFGKRYQKELDIFANDYFQLQFFEDISKYGVDVPEELEAVLESDPEAQKILESLSDGKIRSIIYMIARYKNSQTRIDKSLILCDNLKLGFRDPRDLLRPV